MVSAGALLALMVSMALIALRVCCRQIESLDGLRAVTRGKIQLLREELLREHDRTEEPGNTDKSMAVSVAGLERSKTERRGSGRCRSCGWCGAR